MGGFLPVPGQTAYGASKAAVELLTEGLHAELAQTSVRVTVVFPGAVATNTFYRLYPARATAFITKQMRALLPPPAAGGQKRPQP